MLDLKNANDSIAIYIAKILFAVLILLAFFTTYILLAQRDTQTFDGGARQLRATPNSTSYFLANEYQAGAKPFELNADGGNFLGSDRNASIIAVNMRYQEDGTTETKDLLQIFDRVTHEKRNEVAASGCSNVSPNNIVYCFDREDTKIRGYNVLSGKVVAEFEASKPQTKTRLLGAQEDTDILQVIATDGDQDEISSNKLAAVTGNEVRWTKQLNAEENCNVINRGRTIICRKPHSGSHETTHIRTLKSSDGDQIASRETAAEIALTNDGWMEKSSDYETSQIPTTAALTSHVSVNKADAKPLPEPNKIFGIDAKEKGTSRNWGGNTFYPSESSDKAGNTEALAYPSHVIEGLKLNAGGIVSADGEINLIRVPSLNPSDLSYAHISSPEVVFSISAADQIMTASKNGALVLLKLDNSANKNNDVYTLYDTQVGASVLDIEDAGDDEIDVINGFLAVTKNTKATGGFEKLVVYLPEGK
ncbi:hypothetical protein [Corynebacterium freiburgense]|uniref:hypothetical protein n=1 Tax=Corynebacterium freiburgense TaxID=556548 RepID=UPI000428C212|nr:hypothetical protein [Corynebacterium freiburgense]WJZ03037.1 hypothetical protein CFREI_08795 [Corynebacterium freiburgense]